MGRIRETGCAAISICSIHSTTTKMGRKHVFCYNEAHNLHHSESNVIGMTVRSSLFSSCQIIYAYVAEKHLANQMIRVYCNTRITSGKENRLQNIGTDVTFEHVRLRYVLPSLRNVTCATY